jgi:hypothetical protein
MERLLALGAATDGESHRKQATTCGTAQAILFFFCGCASPCVGPLFGLKRINHVAAWTSPALVLGLVLGLD